MKPLTPAARKLLAEVVQGGSARVDGRRDKPRQALVQAGLVTAKPVDDKFPPRWSLRPTEKGIQEVTQ